MLIGHIEEVAWPEQAVPPFRVRIRHRGQDRQLYEVGVDVVAVEFVDVSTTRETSGGMVRVHLAEGAYVANVENHVLVVRRRHSGPPTRKGDPSGPLSQGRGPSEKPTRR